MHDSIVRQDSIFSVGLPTTLVLDTALALALSPEDALRLEVTFDLAGVEPDTFLYLDILNREGNTASHVSFRPALRQIALNTRKSGLWGQEVHVEVPFERLRFWRFWFVAKADGTFGVEFEGDLLCTMPGLFPADEISACGTNVSVRCAAPPKRTADGMAGVLDTSDPQNAKAMVRLSADFDLTAADAMAASVKIVSGEDRSAVQGAEQTPIAGWPWVACSLGPVAGQSLRLEIGEGSADLTDLRGQPVVELSSSDIVLRTAQALRADAVCWRSEAPDRRTGTRLTTTDDDNRDPRGFSFQRHFTPLSEFMRLVPKDGISTRVTLEVPGASWELALDEAIYRAIEDRARLLALQGEDVPQDWKMICLDWWSVLQIPAQRAIIAREAPFLFKFLTEHGQEIGGSRAVQDVLGQKAAAGPAKAAGPKLEDMALWRALSAVSDLLISPTVSPDTLRQAVRQEMGLLPGDVRTWFLLEIASTLLERGQADLLRDHVPDDFVQSAISEDQPLWLRSTILTVLAARGQFGECAVVLESLAKKPAVGINVQAIAATIVAANRSDVPTDTWYRLMYTFLYLLEGFESREFTPFRHRALIVALLSIVQKATRQPHFFQRDLLSKIETLYSTVPEFWDAFDAMAEQMPTCVFLDECRDLAHRARNGNDFLRRVTLRDADTARGSDLRQAAPPLAAAGERQDLLGTFLGMHGYALPATSKTTHDLCRDSLLRDLAHPFAPQAKLGDTRLPVPSMRAAINDLQRFPKTPHKGVLETLGKALLKGDAQAVLEYFPLVMTGGLGDPKSDAIVLDAVTWALTGAIVDNDRLAAVIMRLLKLVEPIEKLSEAPPALEAALRRICRHRSTDSRTADHVEAVQDRYRMFVPEWTLPAEADTTPGGYYSDTLIALISCRKYLDSRAQECRDTWIRDVTAAGARVLIFYGSDDNTSGSHLDAEAGLVQLPVGDSYEDLPAKSVEVFRWVMHNRDEQFVLKIDDDCYLDAENFLGALSYRRDHYFGREIPSRHENFDRIWHQGKSAREVNQRAIDTSLLGSWYADGGGGYVLSRSALRSIDEVAASAIGTRIRLASYFEDKMIGDLLWVAGIRVSSDGYASLQARRTHSGAMPVLQWDRLFYPSALSGIPIAHLDRVGLMHSIRDNRQSARLDPPRIWSMTKAPGLLLDSNMLELLTVDDAHDKLNAAEVVCVAAFRNEISMLPHFLEHYRSLGTDLFLIVDNLSDDGTREYLFGQPDVLLFSASNDYKDSHFAVDWQRMLLDHFCAGKWVVVADADEFLLTPKQGAQALKKHCRVLEEAGFDAALVYMVDMYPAGPMEEADFAIMQPRDAAQAFDRRPVRIWPMNTGPFGNMTSYVSAVRHRLMPHSAPWGFTSQKVALFKFNPLMSFSEGFHFGTGMRISPDPIAFLHYKFSAAFAAKARREALRGQHFGGGSEYAAYLKLIENGLTSLWQDGLSECLDLDREDALSQILHGLQPPEFW